MLSVVAATQKLAKTEAAETALVESLLTVGVENGCCGREGAISQWLPDMAAESDEGPWSMLLLSQAT